MQRDFQSELQDRIEIAKLKKALLAKQNATTPEETNAYAEGVMGEMLTVKQANAWVQEALKRPDPKMLFGSLWYEGEVGILFASNNLGKSILAVQIAEGVSRGQSTLPLPVTAKPKKVLYIDCELSDKQFQIRYTAGTEVYRFSDNFLRAEINRKKLLEGYSMTELVLRAIESHIRQHQVEVIILDNISALRNDLEKTTDAGDLMMGLQQFQDEHEISILLLAHTPKVQFNQPITDNHLAGSKMLMNLTDSAFTIGCSQQDSGMRYIKQIKVRNSDKRYDAENVIVCEIRKENAFLGFHFLAYEEERHHLQQTGANTRDEELSLVRQMLKDGYSQRQMAEKMSISLGKVNKLVKLIADQDREEAVKRAA